MAKDDGEKRMVLVDEWHVDLYGPADLDEARAQEARDSIGRALLQWAEGEAPLGGGFVIWVEQ